MSDPADPPGSAKAALRAALLDYSHSPGKYQVGLRQPQALFAALREVLQIAVGREGEASARGQRQEFASLRDAARFFVRTALLYPGADHYALLGLERKAQNADLKDRYRLMMRLLHPDFSGPAAGAWPPDSAVRVNRAYDTLSSAVQRRLYDETLPQLQGGPTASNAEPTRPRPVVKRLDEDPRQSRFKTLAVVCAVAGAALVIVIVSATGSPESAQLVQRAHVQPKAVGVAMQEPDQAPSASPVARLQEAFAQLRAAPAGPPTQAPPVTRPTYASADRKPMEPPRPSAPQLPLQASPSTPKPVDLAEPPLERIAQPPRGALLEVALTPSEPKPEIVLAAASVVPPAPMQPAPVSIALAPVQAPPAPRPAFKPGPTLLEAQPLLSHLLQVMEGGRGDRILNLLDPDARSKPSAQALSRQYDSLVDGARPVRVSHVEFKAEPADGRLLVVGYFRVLAGEQPIGALGKKMVLRAEFASREGTVVITGLSGGPVN
jgi:hypothetical protein